MAESETHKGAKTEAAGKGSQTEVPLSRNSRLDALTAGRNMATEIEPSGNPTKLEEAARRQRTLTHRRKYSRCLSPIWRRQWLPCALLVSPHCRKYYGDEEPRSSGANN